MKRLTRYSCGSRFRRAELNMATSRPNRHGALAVGCLVLSVVLLASTSNARAGDITYNIVDYPANEIDASSGTDTISGTIITDGTKGWLSLKNIIGGTFSFTAAQGSAIGPAKFGSPVGLEATSTQLLLESRVDSSFSISTSYQLNPNQEYEAQVGYNNIPAGGIYNGSLASSYYDPPLALTISEFGKDTVPTVPGSIGANSPWIIATVPEPSTFVFLVVGGVGIGGYRCWVRRSRGGQHQGQAGATLGSATLGSDCNS